MANPVLVEAIRRPLVESVHRGALAIVSAEGEKVLTLGDVGRPVYPRSAVKALQALPLIESGAADRFGFSDDELALACSSHNGEGSHVAAARSMLAKAGLGEDDLECGSQPPRLEADRLALAERDEAPGRIHNNCSGKHAGMLAVAAALGGGTKRYVRRDHEVQRLVAETIAQMTDATLGEDRCGTDGCSIPTFAVPLSALALAFARLGTGEGLLRDRAVACSRLRAACAAHPFMVAGTGRFCTEVMTATGPAAFVKTGAEGVFCAAFPDRGLGVAVKIDDGATRASEALMAAVVQALVPLSGQGARVLARWARPRLVNWAGEEVGRIRLTAEVRGLLPDA